MRTITLGPPPPPGVTQELKGPPPPPRVWHLSEIASYPEPEKLAGVTELLDIPAEPTVLLAQIEEPEFEETVLLADPDPMETAE